MKNINLAIKARTNVCCSGCTVWNKEEPSKIRLSALEIGSAIFERSRERSDSNIYAGAGVAFAVVIGALPAIFQLSSIIKTFQVRQ